ncbi:MAG TPA: hypothetical protein VFY45_27900 [Baekduia sp.]|nr:hypothetical protein [Baekduia sp.]
MAKSKRDDVLFDHLRTRGVRKKVAKALSGGNGATGRRKAEALARTAIADLRSASEAIKDRVVNRDSKRSEAAKKAARTRKRKAAKRLNIAVCAACVRSAAVSCPRRISMS